MVMRLLSASARMCFLPYSYKNGCHSQKRKKYQRVLGRNQYFNRSRRQKVLKAKQNYLITNAKRIVNGQM